MARGLWRGRISAGEVRLSRRGILRAGVALWFVVFLHLGLAPSALGSSLVEDLEREILHQMESASRSLVTVVAISEVPSEGVPASARRDDSRGGIVRRSTGCGMVLDSLGYILTTCAVVEGAVRVDLYPVGGGRRTKARLVGVDPVTDLALLKAEGGKWAPPTIGDSQLLRSGSWVTVLGNAYGRGPSVATGVVSRRSRFPGVPGEVLIQMNVRVCPGDMGGLVLNSRGEVVGLVCAALADPRPASVPVGSAGEGRRAAGVGIWSDSAVSFAIPFSSALAVVERLKQGKGIQRGFLGVEIGDLAATSGEEKSVVAEPTGKEGGGVRVVSVLEGSPAKIAGLRPADVIVMANGAEVLSPQALRGIVQTTSPGATLRLVIRRGNDVFPLWVKVGELHPGGNLTGKAAPARPIPSADPTLGSLGAERDSLDQRMQGLMQELTRLKAQLESLRSEKTAPPASK